MGRRPFDYNRLARFADLVAGDAKREGVSPAEASRQMGFSQQFGDKLMRRMKDELGWQAK